MFYTTLTQESLLTGIAFHAFLYILAGGIILSHVEPSNFNAWNGAENAKHVQLYLEILDISAKDHVTAVKVSTFVRNLVFYLQTKGTNNTRPSSPLPVEERVNSVLEVNGNEKPICDTDNVTSIEHLASLAPSNSEETLPFFSNLGFPEPLSPRDSAINLDYFINDPGSELVAEGLSTSLIWNIVP